MIHTGLPSALRLMLAGADSCGEPKAFAVTARRQIDGKYFSQFRPFRPFRGVDAGRAKRSAQFRIAKVSHSARHTGALIASFSSSAASKVPSTSRLLSSCTTSVEFGCVGWSECTHCCAAFERDPRIAASLPSWSSSTQVMYASTHSL